MTPQAGSRRSGRDETHPDTSYALSLVSRREWSMLCRIRNAAVWPALVMSASILTSTDRTATVTRTFTFADPDGYHVTLHERA